MKFDEIETERLKLRMWRRPLAFERLQSLGCRGKSDRRHDRPHRIPQSGKLARIRNRLDQPHVISPIHPDNTASMRVAERIGEKFERHTRLSELDVLVYGIARR